MGLGLGVEGGVVYYYVEVGFEGCDWVIGDVVDCLVFVGCWVV